MDIAASAKIFPTCRIVGLAAAVTVGAFSQLDDFAFLNVGKRCHIGRFVHIASFVSVIGGGEFSIDDFSGLSAGCRIVTGTDDYLGPFLTNPTVPPEFTNATTSHVTIERHVIVGTNAVILPGVTVGEGAAIGACAVVRRDVPPWGVYAGEPLRRIGIRDRVAIVTLAARLLERLAAEADRGVTEG